MSSYVLGQMSMFDFLADIESTALSTTPATVKESGMTDCREEKDYLNVGERIISLLREKGQKKKDGFKKSPFMEAFSFLNYRKKVTYSDKACYLRNQVARKMIRPVMDELQKEDESYDFSPLTNLFLEFSDVFKITPVEKETYENRLLFSFYYNKAVKYHGGIEITLTDGKTDEKVYAHIARETIISNKKSGCMFWLRSDPRKKRKCIDMGNYFSNIVLFIQLRKMVQDSINDGQDKSENPLYCFMLEQCMKMVEESLNGSGIMEVSEQAAETGCIQEFLKINDIPYRVVYQEEYKSMKYAERSKVKTIPDFFYVFMLSDKLEKEIILKLIQPTYDMSRCMCDTFERVFEIYNDERMEDEYEKSLRSEYAKSYQTKKDISNRIIKAMEKSDFNNWFGYVEFDHDCDVDKLNEYYKEFEALAKKLNFKKRELVSLRFRKLGHHKASGLYYPFFKCICVDIRNPFSMAHEYFHMLDYENGRLSKKVQFSEVKELYKKSVLDYAENNEDAKNQLQGKTKYNADYYFQATEIFARCGEMYLTDILQINNSLCRPESGFAYPKNEALLKIIKEYFDNFFNV